MGHDFRALSRGAATRGIRAVMLRDASIDACRVGNRVRIIIVLIDLLASEKKIMMGSYDFFLNFNYID